ncbi:peptidoglycan editing factor PgeF [Pseudorhodoferax sp. Leaf267]|uniref:peptidoglycan editing factor PgeF n=1 Tax=Pseudorhodoferax sp. Leaf267 TaxID=1736316 RepID=UPI0006F996BC|nr:peptidoglycan editing factor PgeF [Pseudorhodoferax sp. Leaf267]KQP17324.1 laccase [Pseudorhodoferax sp. Leaf267]
MASPADWLVPDWPAPAHVHAVHTTRAGGVSQAPYASMNLGDHVGDHTTAVAENRLRMAQALQAEPVFLQQVHGTEVLHLPSPLRVADACVSVAPGAVCTIMVADCLAVLFTDPSGRCVAAAHAGWRGLAGEGGVGVLETTVAAVRQSLGDRAAPLLAWLGPCIGPDAFEVGPEVRAAFAAQSPEAARFFRPHGAGKWLADLQGLARQRLQALGLASIHGNDGSPGWCTVGNPSRFFSHRRDRVSGRMAACIWRSA